MVLHETRQVLVVYQNKVQVICYENGGGKADDGTSPRCLPLEHNFSFFKVARELQALKAQQEKGESETEAALLKQAVKELYGRT